MIDTRLLELLASKICHDLISPVGAIANGVEIMGELGADAGVDVSELIAYSAAQATAKLKLMRMVYGLGGADTSIKQEEIHSIFSDFLGAEGRMKLDWNAKESLGEISGISGFPKILLGGLLFLIDGLPKGGTIKVSSSAPNDIIITAEGENAALKPEFMDAFLQKISTDSLSPKLAHACIYGILAQHYDFLVSMENAYDRTILLKISHPVVQSSD